MRYSFWRASCQVWGRRRTYIWIIAELAIVVAVLIYSYTVSASGRAEGDRLGKLYLDEQEYITYSLLKEQQEVTAGITVSDVRLLEEEFSRDAAFMFYICEDIILYDGDNFFTTFIIFANPAFFTQYGITPPDASSGLIGEEVKGHLSKNPMVICDYAVSLFAQDIVLEDTSYPLNSFTSDAMVPRGSFGEALPLSQCVVLPDSLRPPQWGPSRFGTMLFIRYFDAQNIAELRQQIMSRLSQLHNDAFSYDYISVLDDFLEAMSVTFADAEFFSFISWICILISAYGVTGILLTLLQQRRKQYAVALALGATRWQIRMEAFCEMLTVSTIGCGLGFVCGCVCTYLLPNFRYPLIISWETAALALGIAVTIAFVSCLVVLPSINGIHPAEVLKSE